MNDLKKYFAEGIGTMFLVLLACGSAVLAGPVIGGYGIGVCFGLVLICLCYCIGNISGCHVNPAVSFGVWLNGGMSLKDMICYWIFQIAGASAGAVLLYCFWCLGGAGAVDTFNFGGITVNNGEITGVLAANVLQPGATGGLALLMEGLLTFFFVFTILGATDKELGFGKFAGLAIGIALGLVNIVGIPVDNCSVNPARSFGPALFSPHAWGDYWIMIVGPLAGALIAVVAWKAVKIAIEHHKKEA